MMCKKTCDLKNTIVVLHGEVEDLRVMYTAAERSCKAAEKQKKEIEEQRQKEVGILETKVNLMIILMNAGMTMCHKVVRLSLCVCVCVCLCVCTCV